MDKKMVWIGGGIRRGEIIIDYHEDELPYVCSLDHSDTESGLLRLIAHLSSKTFITTEVIRQLINVVNEECELGMYD